MKPSKSTELEFRYLGGNYIDINTLLTSQFHFLAIVNELQRELFPDQRINIKIGGFKEGSFIVKLLLESSWVANLLHHDNAAAVTDIFKTLKELLDLYKLLKGEKPVSVKQLPDNKIELNISIEGNNNVVLVSNDAFNLYKENQGLNNMLQKNFETLTSDNSVTGIEITDQTNPNKVPLISVPRDDFDSYQVPNKYFDNITFEETQIDQTLFIKKPNLFPEKGKVCKWDFIHKGRDITAKIESKEFLQKINDGLKVGQGDRLLADIKVYMKYDERLGTHIETGKYDVVNVKNIVPRQSQFKMDIIK